MANTLTIEIPNSVYELLHKKAREIGQTPEQIALKWVENAAKQLSSEDPLLQLAGTFESENTNISDKHDEYIGQKIRNY